LNSACFGRYWRNGRFLKGCVAFYYSKCLPLSVRKGIHGRGFGFPSSGGVRRIAPFGGSITPLHAARKPR
jgi:hypothetical protein